MDSCLLGSCCTWPLGVGPLLPGCCALPACRQPSSSRGGNRSSSAGRPLLLPGSHPHSATLPPHPPPSPCPPSAPCPASGPPPSQPALGSCCSRSRSPRPSPSTRQPGLSPQINGLPNTPAPPVQCQASQSQAETPRDGETPGDWQGHHTQAHRRTGRDPHTVGSRTLGPGAGQMPGTQVGRERGRNSRGRRVNQRKAMYGVRGMFWRQGKGAGDLARTQRAGGMGVRPEGWPREPRAGQLPHRAAATGKHSLEQQCPPLRGFSLLRPHHHFPS